MLTAAAVLAGCAAPRTSFEQPRPLPIPPLEEGSWTAPPAASN
nr:hypothetical protein [Corynebacterium aquatimens]